MRQALQAAPNFVSLFDRNSTIRWSSVWHPPLEEMLPLRQATIFASLSWESNQSHDSWTVLSIKFVISWLPHPSLKCCLLPWGTLLCTCRGGLGNCRGFTLSHWSTGHWGYALSYGQVTWLHCPYLIIGALCASSTHSQTGPGNIRVLICSYPSYYSPSSPAELRTWPYLLVNPRHTVLSVS